MTDRDVYEHFYRAYVKPEVQTKIAAYEEQLAAIEKAHAAQPLEVRKAEFWAMCRDFGCSEADTQQQWEAYLKGGG